MRFFAYFTCLSSSEVCGCSYRLLNETCGGLCQKYDSDKLRNTVENLYKIHPVEMIRFALQRIWSLQ